jgi:hypothetical protein
MQKTTGLLLILMAVCVACSPQVSITEPDDGAAFDEGALVAFACTATDFEDGELSEESVVWYADSEDNTLGTGTEIETAELSQGEHTITAMATDSDGRVGTDEITIIIGQAGPTTTTTAAPSTATIGAAGGTVSWGQATLEIPPGALQADTEVSLAESDNSDGCVGSAYDVQPNGLQLAKPAVLTIDYAADDLPEGAEADSVAIASLDEHYEPAADNSTAALLTSMPYYVETDVNANDTTASAQLAHFSRYGLKYVCVWEPKQGGSTFFVHPQAHGPCEKFDHGTTRVLDASVGCQRMTSAQYDLEKRSIDLYVDIECWEAAGAGDLCVTVLISKIFRVDPGESPGTFTGVVGCTVVDIGGTEWPQTGNCNWGERRVRVMDLGSGQTTGDRIPLQVAAEGDEWIDLPWGTATQHASTGASGKDYLMQVTFTVGHYYAVVVDLTASSGANFFCGRNNLTCCPSSQKWSDDEFYVKTVMLTGP